MARVLNMLLAVVAASSLLGLAVHQRAQGAGFKGPMSPQRGALPLRLRIEGVPEGTPVTIQLMHPDTAWPLSYDEPYVVGPEPWEAPDRFADAEIAVQVVCSSLTMCGSLQRARPRESPHTLGLVPGRVLRAGVTRGPGAANLVVALFGHGYLGLATIGPEGHIACVVPRGPTTMVVHDLPGQNVSTARRAVPPQAFFMSGTSTHEQRVRMQRRPSVQVRARIDADIPREHRSGLCVWAEQGDVRLHGLLRGDEAFALWEGPWTLHATAVRADGVRLRGSVSVSIDLENPPRARLWIPLRIDP